MTLADDARALSKRRQRELAESATGLKRLNRILRRVQAVADNGEFTCKAPFFFRPLNDAELDVVRGHGFHVWKGVCTGTVYIKWYKST